MYTIIDASRFRFPFYCGTFLVRGYCFLSRLAGVCPIFIFRDVRDITVVHVTASGVTVADVTAIK